MFRNQKNLEFLDLSYNDIEYLPGKIFKNAINIKQLLLQGNRLYKWGVKINHMRYLIFLDISGNRLETFTPVDIEHLNQHFQSENLTVDLSNNRLSCTCENINFLLWIVRFYSHFQDFNEYFCLDESIHVENLQKSLFILNKKCKSYLIWYVISCIGCTLMVTITACYLIYKNRWKIRYIRYVAGKKVRGYHRLQSSSSIGDFEYDAYISYSAKDVSFVKEDMIPNLEDKSSGQIKLAVMHRDMEPSGDHANNIMDYISRSKRTICVVTRKFLESDWQDYELNMARMEGVQTRKTLNFVHLILMPDVCKSKYPQKASDFIKKGYYLEYPEEAFGQQVFWETLRQEILKEIDISN
ncbi:toll-like receptor 4 [Saccostrea cucullata]|uniref:toll-like receptor 4 n=1 Tax=Saccostrea cuccullata TaxID=36930 RepID=UPI002ED3EE38